MTLEERMLAASEQLTQPEAMTPNILTKEQITADALRQLIGREVLLTAPWPGIQTATAQTQPSVGSASVVRVSPSGEQVELTIRANNYWLPVANIERIEVLTVETAPPAFTGLEVANVLNRLRCGSCFCEAGIDNPMAAGRHTDACRDATEVCRSFGLT